MPTSRPGRIRLSQFLAIAIAAAVVPPPIFALEQIIASSMPNLKIFAPASSKVMFTTRMIRQQTKKSGASPTRSANTTGADMDAKKR